MSSSRPPEAGTELPDRADLPDDDGATAPDLFPEGVGFRDDLDDDTDERMTYAAPAPAEAAVRPESGQDGEAETRVPLRRRLAHARDQVRPWSAWTLRAKLVASMLALFTVLSMMTAVFSVTALSQSLIGQVDQQLSDSLNRPSRGGGDDDGGAGGGPGADRMEVYLTTDGNAGYVYRSGVRTNLTSSQIALVKAAG